MALTQCPEKVRVGGKTYRLIFRDLLPAMEARQWSDLIEDVRARRAVLVNPVIDEYGNVIDGIHRLRAAAELEAEYGILVCISFDVKPGLSDDEKRDLALAMNLHRRHLGRLERQTIVQDLRSKGWSAPRIAQVLGVSADTALRDSQRSTSASAEVDQPERVECADGKSRPASLPTAEDLAIRDAEVARLEAEGLSSQAIAEAIGVSKGSVANSKARNREGAPKGQNNFRAPAAPEGRDSFTTLPPAPVTAPTKPVLTVVPPTPPTISNVLFLLREALRLNSLDPVQTAITKLEEIERLQCESDQASAA